MAFRYLVSPYALDPPTVGRRGRYVAIADDYPAQLPGEPERWREVEFGGGPGLGQALVLCEDTADTGFDKARRRPGVELLPDLDPIRGLAELTAPERRPLIDVVEDVGGGRQGFYRRLTGRKLDGRLGAARARQLVDDAIGGRPYHLVLRALTAERTKPRLDGDTIVLDGPTVRAPKALPLPSIGRASVFPEWADEGEEPVVGTPYYDTASEPTANPAGGWTALGGLPNFQNDGVELYGATGAGWPWAYYSDGANVGPDVMALVDIIEAGNEHWIGARFHDVGSGGDYYATYYQGGTPQLILRRGDNGSETTLGAAMTLTTNGGYAADGDAIGLWCWGDRIRAYWEYFAGSWTEYGERTDTTYNVAGQLSLYMDSSGGAGAYGSVYAGSGRPPRGAMGMMGAGR